MTECLYICIYHIHVYQGACTACHRGHVCEHPVCQLPAGEVQHAWAAATYLNLHTPLLPPDKKPHAGRHRSTVHRCEPSASFLHLHQHPAGPKNGPPQSGPG